MFVCFKFVEIIILEILISYVCIESTFELYLMGYTSLSRVQ